MADLPGPVQALFHPFVQILLSQLASPISPYMSTPHLGPSMFKLRLILKIKIINNRPPEERIAISIFTIREELKLQVQASLSAFTRLLQEMEQSC
jgi:hypothetical protein